MPPTNLERADRAAYAIEAFREAAGLGDEELDTIMSDLLGDLMHLANQYEVNFEERLRIGELHFQEEILEDTGKYGTGKYGRRHWRPGR